MKKIVLASSNKGKIKEVSDILTPLGFEVIPQTQFKIPDADETGFDFSVTIPSIIFPNDLNNYDIYNSTLLSVEQGTCYKTWLVNKEYFCK